MRVAALATRRVTRFTCRPHATARASASATPPTPQFFGGGVGGGCAFATASALPIPTPTALPPRTHTCGDLRAADDGASVTLAGWVDECVKKKGVVFAKLRDERGVTQLMWSEKDRGTNGFAEAGRLATESVVVVEGTARARPARHAARPVRGGTGAVEVHVARFRLVNAAAFAGSAHANVTPLGPNPAEVADAATRLRHRHLDLRLRPALGANLRVRAAAVRALRGALDAQRFTEVETPTLFKTTPEGAREFLVPSRQHAPGTCYALAQSPQQYKQLLVAGGVDRYYQVARCYRDEARSCL